MTTDEIRAGVTRVLTTIAPEARGQPLAPTVNLREQLDLDSMDTLNVVIGLHEAFGVEIPEADYAQLESLDAIVTYLMGRLAGHQGT